MDGYGTSLYGPSTDVNTEKEAQASKRSTQKAAGDKKAAKPARSAVDKSKQAPSGSATVAKKRNTK